MSRPPILKIASFKADSVEKWHRDAKIVALDSRVRIPKCKDMMNVARTILWSIDEKISGAAKIGKLEFIASRKRNCPSLKVDKWISAAFLKNKC